MLFFKKVLFHNASLIFMFSYVLKEDNFFSQWVMCGSVDREFWFWLSSFLTVSLLLLFSCPVVSDSLWPHRLPHDRLPCPPPSPRVWQVHVHCVSDAVQPSHPLTPSSPSALNLSQHQGLFQHHLFTSDDQNTGASTSASVSWWGWRRRVKELA